MNNLGGSLTEMVQSSMVVMRQPSVATFERYERRGTLQQALIYVALAALLAGLFGILDDAGGALRSIIGVIVNFLVFTFATFRIGQSQGGTGTLDEVAYTFSLFIAPLQVIGAVIGTVLAITGIGLILVPIVALVLLVAQVYYAYIAVQSSMNLTTPRAAWITLGTAFLFSFIASIILNSIF